MRGIPLSAGQATFEAFEARVEASALDEHLGAYERAEAEAESGVAMLLCPACGHDQDDHAPDNLPPYVCTMLGCRCSRTPDHLVVHPSTEPGAA